jgi:hypothetical protein
MDRSGEGGHGWAGPGCLADSLIFHPAHEGRKGKAWGKTRTSPSLAFLGKIVAFASLAV